MSSNGQSNNGQSNNGQSNNGQSGADHTTGQLGEEASGAPLTAPVERPKTTGLHVGEATPGVKKVDPIIIADGVRRSFGGVTAVDVEHLEIPRGAITALIGPNGAGKTTLFNLLTGFDKPDEGSWSFDGKSLSGVPAFRVARMGLVRTFSSPRRSAS